MVFITGKTGIHKAVDYPPVLLAILTMAVYKNGVGLHPPLATNSRKRYLATLAMTDLERGLRTQAFFMISASERNSLGYVHVVGNFPDCLALRYTAARAAIALASAA